MMKINRLSDQIVVITDQDTFLSSLLPASRNNAAKYSCGCVLYTGLRPVL
ncbi:MAG: hypothetical protein U0T81_11690 [Saprospiraceae bacterium]